VFPRSGSPSRRTGIATGLALKTRERRTRRPALRAGRRMTPLASLTSSAPRTRAFWKRGTASVSSCVPRPFPFKPTRCERISASRSQLRPSASARASGRSAYSAFPGY